MSCEKLQYSGEKLQ